MQERNNPRKGPVSINRVVQHNITNGEWNVDDAVKQIDDNLASFEVFCDE